MILNRVAFLVVGLLFLLSMACRQTSLESAKQLQTTLTSKLTTVVVEEADRDIVPTSTPPEHDLGVEMSERVWRVLDVTGGGGTTGLAFHPTDAKIVYMASDNTGLFKTENGGDSWFSVSSNLGAYRLGFVALDPLNPEVIYVTTRTKSGGGLSGGSTGEIHRSLNGGRSWQFVTDLMGFQSSFPSQTSLVFPFDPTEPNRFDRDGNRLTDTIIVGAWTGPADPPVGGIWRSEDEGETFTHVALQDKNMTAVRAFPGDYNLVYATTYDGHIYRSQDLGHHWEDITANMPLPQISDLAVHPSDPNLLYVTCRACVEGEAAVWKTVDGGQAWQPASKGLDTEKTEGFPRIIMDRFDAETLYVTTFRAIGHQGSVRKTTDGGRSWTVMPARLVLPDGRPFHTYEFERQLTIGQAIDGTLYSGGSGAWRFPDGNPEDGQEVWEPATIGLGNVHVNTIAVNPFDAHILYQGISDFGPYRSDNQGQTFHRTLGTGWPVTVKNFVWNGPYYTNYHHCQLSCSASCDSKARIVSGGTYDFAISQQDGNIVYSAFGSGSGKAVQGGVNKSTDGGITWFPVGFQMEQGFALNPKTCVPYGFRYLAIDPTDDRILFAAQEKADTSNGILYKTIDGGQTWEAVFTADRFLTGLAISAVDPDLVVFSIRNSAFKSVEGGISGSWQEITPEEVKDLRVINLSPHQRDVIVIGTNAQGMYYSADGGQSWRQETYPDLFAQKLFQGSQEMLSPEIATALNTNRQMLKNISVILFDPLDPDTFYISGRQYHRAGIGVAKITNAGQNWERLPLAGLSSRNIFDMAVDATGEFLYAGTFNGTYQLRLR